MPSGGAVERGVEGEERDGEGRKEEKNLEGY